MTQPPGFVDQSQPHHVCKLRKSLYGLKQAPRAWYEELYTTLLSLGFQSSTADPSLFIHTSSSITFLLVYVDDILITGSSPTTCNHFISQLSSRFAMKNLGPLHYFLGIQVHRTPTSIFLSQAKYIQELLTKASMVDCKPCTTPASLVKLDTTSGDLLHDPTQYRSLVGALQYLTWTRPDIAFAVNQVCQHMQTPRIPHLSAVKRILRFLKGTPDQGLLFTKGSQDLIAYSDADWAGCPIDRRSVTGFCLYLGPNLISWCAKKQPCVSRSSTESEYRSLAQTASEITWLCGLLKDLHFYLAHPPLLLCDNVSALALASNPVFHARSKHIEVDYHYIRTLVTSNSITISYLPTHD
ncbi:uncharacterized protein LOC110748084 [Prunus avium]|uniref:Uncharacterized protein LOC110748084 n=1 Tax=Prunus avium TaxID=42229 RepID=A0A6P5RFY2_PRUAV|nr:uncharacterized protein LOC110748084 [Prunus avium]